MRALLTGAAIAAFCVLAAPGTHAAEGIQSYLKGFRDFGAGVLPTTGVFIRNDLYIYSGKDNSTVPQGKLAAAAHAYANILSATVITPFRIWNADYAFAIRGAVSHLEGDRSLTTPMRTVTTDGSLTSYNDIVINPLILGWHNGNWHWNFVTAVWVPVGDYDSTRLVNTGKNHWAWSPQFGITYFDPRSGWEVSGALNYVVNAENPATRYRSGDELQLDLTVGRRIAPNIMLGLTGYIVEQTTDDSGSGATAGPRRAQVLGLGPAVRFRIKSGNTPVAIIAKYSREFSARNTTEGDAANLSVRVKF